ncbi:amidohydrolase family protein [Flavitalea sp. BT771]|uniref:amidohydrolase family protein n=1 Tax=Flavitalea sp. BT771 TaxID=3063329 RepID=UPI0026E3F4DA|nr:amidohydrolase family protein [Flavitalea sp. BT771]MDO6433132.1 amidohydrolase family protein [Flavitalea sp. BT771]MDV6221592.1 amidohydrolase family protein [Flavitalea sp. BT771]
MGKRLLLLFLALREFAAMAQNPDSATFLLHKFAQNIGKESYIVHHTDSGLFYDVTFKFTDRGTPVPLKARLGITAKYDPLSLWIKGNTSRFSTINDSIVIHGRTASIRVDDSTYSRDLSKQSFLVAGYAPGTVQMMLLKYWESHGKPDSISILPSGTVRIRKDGADEVGPMLLDRYVISGLVWGNELLWTGPGDQLLCIITNDAEGDKLEIMQEQYESLLPRLLRSAAMHGMQLFTKEMAGARGGKASGVGQDVSSFFGKGPSSLSGKYGASLGKAQPTAIVGGTLIDVVSGVAMKDAVVLIDGGLIKAVGKAGELAVPAGYTVVHAEGKTILPGLWDMHAHFEQAEWGPAYLAAGVTTVRDCGNEFEYIDAIQGAIDGGKGVGPHILKAGIIDGPGPMGLGIVRASTAEEAVAIVRKYKEHGFVQIKIYSSVTPPVVKAICDEAHRLGLTVTGHIPEGMTLQQGVDSGMDMINHIQYVYQVMKRNKDRSVDLTDSTNQEVLRFVKAHGTVIDPTLGVFEMIFRNTKDDITQMEPAYQTLPLPLQALFRNMGMAPDVAPRYKPIMASAEKITKALFDAGVPIVAGTDMGFPGYSVARELELYVDAGFTPLEAIQSATIVPAQVMKLDKVTGRIAPGFRADLVIVEGDPLARIRDIRNVRTVVKDGRVYDPVVLHGLAGFGK